MTKENTFLSKIEQTVLDLLANEMFDAGKSIADDIPWNLVWYEAYTQTVSVQAFSGVVPESCPEEALTRIRKQIRDTLSSSLVICREHAGIHRLLSENNIEYMIIKGVASALYYKDPLVRLMGDVDFLVDIADLERVCTLLEQNGFEAVSKSHFNHYVYKNERCRFEVHFEPAGIPVGGAGRTVRKYLEDAMSQSRTAVTPYGEMRVPSVFHHGLIILLHKSHHLTNEGLGLRHLCDWACFVSSMSEKEFCEIFEDKLKAIGLWNFAKILTKMCVKYLGCPGQEWAMDADDELVDSLLEDIFAGGNLGQKNSDRGHESLLLSSQKLSVTEKSKHIIKYFNNAVYKNWGAAKHCKALLPVGWAYLSARYIVRSLSGKRPAIRPKAIISETVSRNELYRKIKLFIKE